MPPVGQGFPDTGQATIRAANRQQTELVAFMASRAEKRIWHVYRAEKALAAAQVADMPFFEVASADVGAGNVVTPRSLPEPQIMKIKAISISLVNVTSVATNEADLRNFLAFSYLDFSVNDMKEVVAWRAPRLTSGCGIVSNASAIAGSHAESGWQSPEAIYWLPVPIWIKGGETFECVLKFRAALSMAVATNRAVVELHGPLWKRGFNQ